MKSVTRWIVVLFVLFAVGCGSLGQLEISKGQVAVFTGEEVLADSRKRKALQEEHGVERLHGYVEHYVNRNKMRTSLKLEITITTLRISLGRDHMSTETVLIENGKEIDRFTSVSTSRSGNINKFAKDLSKKIVTRARTF